MEQYNITGMSCAACQARVEKAVSKVDGVESCAVSLLTNSMGITGTAKEEDIIKAVTNAGYGASKRDDGSADAEANGSDKTGASTHHASSQTRGIEDSLVDRETPILIKRLVSSIVFLLVLMYFSMGHMMFKWPLPGFLEDNIIAIALIEMILATIIMYINKKFFVSGFKSVIHGAPNMDTLVALGSGVSFAWSLILVFAMTDAMTLGDMERMHSYAHNLYFESAAMIVTLITVGKLLESISKGRTTDALKSLLKLAAKKANVIRDGVEVEVPIEEVMVGDVVAVRPGENVPIDGFVLEGNTSIDESALTGESIPVDKEVNDTVFAATTNKSGFIKVKATRVGRDTSLSKIIQMVSDAAATKAPIAKVADKVSAVFVPIVIGISIITFIVWMLLGEDLAFSLARAISVLVISCPCALGLATPVAIMVASGVGAKNGVMFKTAVSIEETGKMQIVALDKTGTITKGEPSLTDIIINTNANVNEALKLIYSLEAKSEHPLAKAIVDYAKERNIEALEITDFMAVSGNGLKGKLNTGEYIFAGNESFIKKQAPVFKEFSDYAKKLSSEGKTAIFLAKDKELLAILAVADIIKEDSARAIKDLKEMGLRVVMLTGDNELTAKAIGKEAGVDEVIAGVLPEGKAKAINELKANGKVLMVGDGINDAPALVSADMGFAIGAGTDVAIESADVVLMKSNLSDVVAAIKLSKKALKNIYENLFWAFIYNIIGIPLAAGVYIHLFGWSLNPMFGAAAMSLSSFCVVTNALRLNLFRMRKDNQTQLSNEVSAKFFEVKVKKLDLDLESLQNKELIKGVNTMKKTIKITGMMCGHCEASVVKALEALDGVVKATASYEAGEAVVELTSEVSNETLKAAVEAKDYTVTAIN